MSEVKRKKFFMYLGKDASYGYRALPVCNTLVSARNSRLFLSKVFTSIISEYRPCDINIHYLTSSLSNKDFYSVKRQGEVDSEREVLHFACRNQCVDVNATDYIEPSEFISRIEIMSAKRSSGLFMDLFELFVIDNVNVKIPDNLLKDLQSKNMAIVYITDNDLPASVIEQFDQHVWFCDANYNMSRKMFDDAIYVNFHTKAGKCYVSYKGETPVLLYVPFTPDSVVMKLFGAYSHKITYMVDKLSTMSSKEKCLFLELIQSILREGTIIKISNKEHMPMVKDLFENYYHDMPIRFSTFELLSGICNCIYLKIDDNGFLVALTNVSDTGSICAFESIS